MGGDSQPGSLAAGSGRLKRARLGRSTPSDARTPARWGAELISAGDLNTVCLRIFKRNLTRAHDYLGQETCSPKRQAAGHQPLAEASNQDTDQELSPGDPGAGPNHGGGCVPQDMRDPGPDCVYQHPAPQHRRPPQEPPGSPAQRAEADRLGLVLQRYGSRGTIRRRRKHRSTRVGKTRRWANSVLARAAVPPRRVDKPHTTWLRTLMICVHLCLSAVSPS